MMPNCRSQWTERQVAQLEEEYRKIYDYIIDSFHEGILPIYCSTINTSFEQVLKHDLDYSTGNLIKREERRHIVRCGMGTSMGSIGYDGSIYGCQEQDSKDHKSIFYIGDIYRGIDRELHHNLLAEYGKAIAAKCEDSSYCVACPLRSQCASFSCPSTTWDLFGDFHVDAKIHCQWIRIMFEQAARAMRILVGENNQLFKDYLYHQCNFNQYWGG